MHPLKKTAWALCSAMFLLAVTLIAIYRHHLGGWHGNHRLIILGIDGMDPQLLQQFMHEGKMPNFSKLAAQGDFRKLATSTPPQSPVAWSNLITGMNSGGHGIFDFIHRDRKSLKVYFSTSQVEGPKHTIHLGPWRIPLDNGTVEDLRKGEAFWQILDRQSIPYTVFRIPANFPPVPANGKTVSGLGTPDMRGTYGTFSFYTDDPTATPGMIEGGQIIPVEVENSRVNADLTGPDNSFRKERLPPPSPSRLQSIHWSQSSRLRYKVKNSCCAKANGVLGSTSNSGSFPSSEMCVECAVFI